MNTAARGLLDRGVGAAEKGRVAEGLALIREACAADPGRADSHAQLARWLVVARKVDEALAAAERALALAPRDAMTLDTVGVVLSHARQHARAITCFEQAVALEPGRAGAHFNLASSAKFLGRFEAAEQAYEACIAVDPHFWRAHSALAQLRRQTDAGNHIARLETLLLTPELAVDAELHLRHALAKECEDLGRYDEAFTHLVKGKARKRATLGYDFARDAELFAATVRASGSLPPPASAVADTPDAPIFVVGMPRTGTTLVDRILSSHAGVASAGESQNFAVLVKRAARTPSSRVLDVATMERARSLDLAELGGTYLEDTRPARANARFVDKMPLNFFYLGLIARALPRARFVVLRRHALDTCLGNFRQLFALGFSYYDYAFDLLDTGRYYVAFDRLIAHWAAVLPGRVLQLCYEELVRDQRAVTQRLLEFCGLEWDEQCMHFDRNPEAVSTASAAQVREPLNSTGVDRWRRYERQLQPLRELLAAAAVPETR
jgi:tetratricopeptide (TPR) repeat protein